jgi:hypothetical protein
MRIEKFEDIAVAINDEIAIWFKKFDNYYGHVNYPEWAFIGANENGLRFYISDKEDFEAAHPGVIDDILRRLNDEQNV